MHPNRANLLCQANDNHHFNDFLKRTVCLAQAGEISKASKFLATICEIRLYQILESTDLITLLRYVSFLCTGDTLHFSDVLNTVTEVLLFSIMPTCVYNFGKNEQVYYDDKNFKVNDTLTLVLKIDLKQHMLF